MPSDNSSPMPAFARLGRSAGARRAATRAGDAGPWPFQPRLPWIGADLQTLRDFLVPSSYPHDPVETTTLQFVMPDGSGDRLSAILERPRHPVAGRPLGVLIHGLTGCADSHYVKRAAGRLLAEGYPVLRLNLRGAGACRQSCREHYHSGRSEDFEAVLDQLPPSMLGDGMVVLGWSLGANLLLKGLGEFGHRYPIRAAVSVSAPVDLAAAAARLSAPRNWIYHRWLLARMKREAAAAPIQDELRATLARVHGIVEFDDRITAPRNGFADASDYYARCSAIRFMPAIRVPTLVIHALDDPWIPGESYRAFDWPANQNLTPLLPHRGGHVGFHAPRGRVWSDDCTLGYLDRTLTGEAQPALSRWAASIAK